MADIVRIGTLNSPYVNHTYNLKLELTILEQDIAGNRSLIRMRQYAYSTSTSYEAYSGATTNPYWIKIDGANVVYGTKAMDFRDLKIVELGLYEGWVTHGSNGQLTITVSSGFDINGPSSLYDGAVPDYAWVLTTIPRYAAITSFYASDITRNTYKINYATDKPVSAVQYSKDGGAWTTFPAGGSFTGSANATHSMKIRVQATDSGLWTESGTINVVMVKTATANTPSLASKTCIQAVINWSASQTVTEVEYKVGSGAWVSAGTFTARTSGSFTIPGLVPGTAYTIYVRVKDAIHSLVSAQSSGLAVTTVALSSISSGVGFDVEASQGVTISRPDSNLVHDVTLEAYYDGVWNNVPLTAAQSNVATGATLTASAAANTTLFNKHPTTKSISIRVKVNVRWGAGGTIQGTVYKTGTATIVNANPSIASVAYSDTNATIQAIIANNQKILRSKSTLQVVAGLATSQKGATLKTYKVSIGGSEYSANAGAGLTSETGKAITVGTVNQASNQTAVITVTDSRGNIATRSFTVQMLDYYAPQILSAAAQRLNNYEMPTTMVMSARRAAVKPASTDVNEIYLRYRIKLNPSGTYGSYVTLTGVNGSLSGIWQAIAVSQYMDDYPIDQSYTVEIGISDKFTGYVVTTVQLTEGIALMRFLKDRIDVGVPMYLPDGKAAGSDSAQMFKLTDDYGLPKAGNTDLNLVVQAGIYSVVSGSINGPVVGGLGVLEVLRRGVHVYQRMTRSSSSKIFTRFSGDVGVTWTAWVQETSIEESGSNANGSYIKFGDGTMICWQKYSYTVPSLPAWGSVFSSGDSDPLPPPFPASFTSAPDVIRSANQVGANYWITTAAGNATSSTQAQRCQVTRATAATNLLVHISLTAIGRWRV
jgi:hypothetical protein